MPLSEQPEHRGQGPAPALGTTAVMAIATCAQPMLLAPPLPEALTLTAVHLAWVAYAICGLYEAQAPTPAVYASLLAALAAVAAAFGATRENSHSEKYYSVSVAVTHILSASTLFLFIDRAARLEFPEETVAGVAHPVGQLWKALGYR